MDWENDPELKKILQEFIDSLRARREKLEELREELHRSTTLQIERLEELKFVVHKLGGVAGSYGFDGLGEYCAVFDDYLDRHGEGVDWHLVELATSRLEEGIREAEEGEDPSGLTQMAEYKSLKS